MCHIMLGLTAAKHPKPIVYFFSRCIKCKIHNNKYTRIRFDSILRPFLHLFDSLLICHFCSDAVCECTMHKKYIAIWEFNKYIYTYILFIIWCRQSWQITIIYDLFDLILAVLGIHFFLLCPSPYGHGPWMNHDAMSQKGSEIHMYIYEYIIDSSCRQM